MCTAGPGCFEQPWEARRVAIKSVNGGNGASSYCANEPRGLSLVPSSSRARLRSNLDFPLFTYRSQNWRGKSDYCGVRGFMRSLVTRGRRIAGAADDSVEPGTSPIPRESRASRKS